MKKLYLFLILLVGMLVIPSCENGSKNDPASKEVNPIVGTWRYYGLLDRTKYYTDRTFNADGTYEEVHVDDGIPDRSTGEWAMGNYNMVSIHWTNQTPGEERSDQYFIIVSVTTSMMTVTDKWGDTWIWSKQ